MKTRYRITCLMVPFFILGLAVMVPAQPGNTDMDVLSPLKAALEAAEAPDLNPDQESSLLMLVTDFSSLFQVPVENEAAKNARDEYEKAILSLDSKAAVSQADILANSRTDDMALHDEAAAVFAIAAIKILKQDPAQYEALADHIGQDGLVRLILGLFGGPRRGGPGHGPGTPPPPEAPLIS